MQGGLAARAQVWPSRASTQQMMPGTAKEGGSGMRPLPRKRAARTNNPPLVSGEGKSGEGQGAAAFATKCTRDFQKSQIQGQAAREELFREPRGE